jgi:hypothetical protein
MGPILTHSDLPPHTALTPYQACEPRKGESSQTELPSLGPSERSVWMRTGMESQPEIVSTQAANASRTQRPFAVSDAKSDRLSSSCTQGSARP